MCIRGINAVKISLEHFTVGDKCKTCFKNEKVPTAQPLSSNKV